MSAQPLHDEAIEAGRLPAPQGETTGPRRTPLALLDPTPSRRRRLPFILLCVVLAVAAVTTVLILNVSVSRTQYDLVSLRAEQHQVAQDNGTLTEEINNRRAPQNLAKAATEQEMVPGGAPGVIDATKGTVAGTAQPAAREEKDGKPVKDKLLLNAPQTPQERAAAVAKKQEAARQAQEAATAKANGTAVGGTASTPEGTTPPAADASTQPTEAQKAQQDAKTTAEKPKTSDASKDTPSGTGATTPPAGEDLNGGSIPAPQTR